MARGTAAQLEDCRRRLVRETVALIYGDGDPDRQERLLRECRRLKARLHRPGRKGRRRDPMAWRLLEVPVPITTRPAMSLSAKGRLAWTAALDEKLGKPTHMNVYFDPDTNRLGVKAAGGEGSGLPVGGKRDLQVKRLLLAGGVWGRLRLPIAMTPAELDEEAGIWAISLAGQEAGHARG